MLHSKILLVYNKHQKLNKSLNQVALFYGTNFLTLLILQCYHYTFSLFLKTGLGGNEKGKFEIYLLPQKENRFMQSYF